jgi:hypothetical protein
VVLYPKQKSNNSYEFQNRTNYIFKLLKVFYLWKENERKEHVLNVTEITYASPRNVTPLYQEQIAANESLEK